MKKYKKYRRRKYKYKSNPDMKSMMKLFLASALILILIIQGIRIYRTLQLNHKVEKAKSQAAFVQAGFEQDAHSICQKDKAALLSQLLVKELGKPYEYGNEGPNSFDCSGLVKYIFSKTDIPLPRVVREQACIGTPIQEDSLRFGDILFFSTNGTKINHVGIYVGNDCFEHAPRSGEVVRVDSLQSKYYKSALKKAVRILS